MTTTANKLATIYFDEAIHQALRLKAASTHRSISELVNEAVRLTMLEDQEDLHSLELRSAEPTMTYEELLDDLKEHGKL